MRITLLIALILIQISLSSQQQVKEIDLIIKNTTIVDVIEKKPLENQTIGIHKGRILFIKSDAKGYTSKKIIDGSGFIALPGFINTHTHLWQHIRKASYPKGNLQEWIRIYAAIHCLTPDEVYRVVLAAASEALLSGITTVSDYASLAFNDYGFDMNVRAMIDAGLGGVVVWHNPSVFLPDAIKEEVIRAKQKALKDTLQIWMGHGPLSFHTLPQVYSGIRIGQRLGMSMTEHTMENVQEQRDLFDHLTTYLGTFGKQLSESDRKVIEEMLLLRRPSNVDSYEQISRDASQTLGNDSPKSKLTADEMRVLESLKTNRTISPLILLEHLDVLKDYLAIHSVWQQPEDIETMKKFNMAVSHNPESNLYLSSGIAPVNDYLKAGINISLGTDGAASNDAINFFSAMKEMWNSYKFDMLNTEVTGGFDQWNIIQAATINGARALKIDAKTGSISVGKEADLLLLSKSELGMSPFQIEKVIPLIIYSANTRNLKFVISDGRILVRNGSLVKFSEAKLSKELTDITTKVGERLKTGKIWRDNYKISTSSFQRYWYKYRSIRVDDSVDLTFENSGNETIKFTIVSSGTVFSGGVSYVAAEEVNQRFPQDPAIGSFSKQFSLLSKQRFQILKKKGEWNFILKTAGKEESYSTKSGQLLVLAEK